MSVTSTFSQLLCLAPSCVEWNISCALAKQLWLKAWNTVAAVRNWTLMRHVRWSLVDRPSAQKSILPFILNFHAHNFVIKPPETIMPLPLWGVAPYSVCYSQSDPICGNDRVRVIAFEQQCRILFNSKSVSTSGIFNGDNWLCIEYICLVVIEQHVQVYLRFPLNFY